MNTNACDTHTQSEQLFSRDEHATPTTIPTLLATLKPGDWCVLPDDGHAGQITDIDGSGCAVRCWGRIRHYPIEDIHLFKKVPDRR